MRGGRDGGGGGARGQRTAVLSVLPGPNCLLFALKCFFINLCTLTETIDQEKEVKHSKLAEGLEGAISDPTKINVKLKVGAQRAFFPHFLCCILFTIPWGVGQAKFSTN